MDGLCNGVIIAPEKFNEIANEAKASCPVSRVLKANIMLEAKLDGV